MHLLDCPSRTQKRFSLRLVFIMGALLMCIMMQSISMPLVSAATTPQTAILPQAFTPPTQMNVALDEVSIVRVIATYSGTGSSPTLCTGLGAIVGSWSQTNPTATEQNNLILTSGSVVSNQGAPCGSATEKTSKQFRLQSLQVLFNTQFNDGKTFYSESKINVSANDIRCADKNTCSAGMSLFSLSTRFANPFITIGENRDSLLNTAVQGQSVQIALVRNGVNAFLLPNDAALSNASEAQAQTYRSTVSQYMNALAVNTPTSQSEPGLLTIDEVGNISSLLLSSGNVADANAVSGFLTAQPEWVAAQSQWQQQNLNTVQGSWRTGIQQYYVQKNFTNASAAFTAAAVNTNFVGAKEFATIAEHQPPAGNGSTAQSSTGANPSSSQTAVPFINIHLPSWWLYATIAVVVLVLLLVVVLIQRSRKKPSPQFWKDWAEAQKEIEQPKSAVPNTNIPKSTKIVQPVATPEMICPRCGTVVPKDASYCPFCSLRLTASDDKETIQKFTVPVQQKYETSMPKPVPPLIDVVPSVQQNKEVPRPPFEPIPAIDEAEMKDKSLSAPSSSIGEPAIVKQGVYSDSLRKTELGVGERAGQQLNSYRLQHLVGQGGSADVYLGEHVYLKTHAAVKILQVRMTGNDTQSFIKEAQIVANLRHPHIVRILDFGLDGSTPFLIMEYAAMGTLRDHYPKGAVLSMTNLLPYVKQVASALQYAHNQRLIHRDIKPENMLLESNKNIVLSDFGLATVTHTASAQNTKQVAGTALYMAPEQFKGKARAASDQYSLAVVVYEWLCGSPPYSEGDFIQLGFQHSYEALPSLRERAPFITAPIEAVLVKALSKDPMQRYESITAFVNALEQAANAS